MDAVKEMISPTKKQTLVDIVHNHILEIIIQEGVTEESVFTEGRLVQQFKVSKPTIREALVRLRNENILKSIPRYGYVIVQMSEKEAHDIIGFRKLLEVASLKESFDHISTEQLQLLEQMLKNHETNQEEKVWDIWMKNIEFHCLLTSFSGNQIYQDYLRRAMQSQAVYFAQSRWKSEKTFFESLHPSPHRIIVDALKQKDLKFALTSLIKDISWI